MRRHPVILLLSVVILSLIPARAQAEKWLLAEEKDKDLRKILEPLLPAAKEQLERFDSDAVVVFSQQQFDIATENYKQYVNLVWWVQRGEVEDITNFVRDFRPGIDVEKVRAFRIRAGSIDPKAALSAPVELLEEERVHIQKGNKDSRGANLVVAFDAAAPGDLLGVSMELRSRSTLRWLNWFVAEDYPVTRAETRTKMQWFLAYSVFGYRLPESGMQKQILKEDKGHIQDLRLWIDGIDPIVEEPWSPPSWLQSPSFSIVWRAEKIESAEDRWIWWYKKHWNQVSVEMANVLEYRMSSRDRIRSVTVADGLYGREAAAALYRFVRDELLDASASLHTEKGSTVNDVLEYRTGDVQEKSYAFAALVAAQGLECELLWTHNPDEGTFFRDYPSWGQIDVPLVRVNFLEENLWYDLGCATCAPGEIRPELRGVDAMRNLSGIIEDHDALIEQVSQLAYARDVDVYDLYFDRIGRKKWSEWVETPGRTDAIAGRTSVTRSYADDSGQQLQIDVTSTGQSAVRTRVQRDKDSEETLQQWLHDRFFSLEAVTVDAASSARTDTLRATLTGECAPLAAPVGDTWVLPADFVYGKPMAGEWPEQRLSPFYVSHTTQRDDVLRVPLPEGWNEVELPRPHSVRADVLEYDVRFAVEDDELVVTRALYTRQCWVSDPDDLAMLGEQARSIRDVETSPVIVQRVVGRR